MPPYHRRCWLPARSTTGLSCMPPAPPSRSSWSPSGRRYSPVQASNGCAVAQQCPLRTLSPHVQVGTSGVLALTLPILAHRRPLGALSFADVRFSFQGSTSLVDWRQSNEERLAAFHTCAQLGLPPVGQPAAAGAVAICNNALLLIGLLHALLTVQRLPCLDLQALGRPYLFRAARLPLAASRQP